MSLFLSITSGFLAATGATLGKLSLSEDSPMISTIQSHCFHIHALVAEIADKEQSYPCEHSIPICSRVFCFALMMYCNALMLFYFIMALERSNSLEVVVLNSAANFISTSIFGQMLFGELVSTKWCIGVAIISIGVSFIYLSGQTAVVKKSKEEI